MGKKLNNDLMVWVDLETTGLNPGSDVVLEIAVAVTDEHGNLINQMSRVIREETAVFHKTIQSMNEFVKEMHTKNGLLEEIWVMKGQSGHSMDEVEAAVLSFLNEHAEKGTVRLCGSTINFDRAFLETHFPSVHDWFDYHNVDVSTIDALFQMLSPRFYQNKPDFKRGVHRGLSDLGDTIALYEWLKDNFLAVAE